MFTSQLGDRLKEYDKYGIHRTNGLKALYVIEVLLLFELLSSLTDPFFYFFFLPLICFNAEIAGNTLQEKYLFLTISVLGSILFVFCFDVFYFHPIMLVFIAFVGASLLYYLVLSQFKNLLLVVPLILSMGSYSLLYGGPSANFYIALNRSLESIWALCIILCALLLFPKSYYLRIWRHAFCDVMEHMVSLTAQISEGVAKTPGISSGILTMERYSKMLPRKGKCYSILRVTLLTYELVVSMSYLISFQKHLRMGYVKVLHHYFLLFCDASQHQKPIPIKPEEIVLFQETHELRVMYKLILSWNYLCR